jgi:hypothetical protein
MSWKSIPQAHEYWKSHIRLPDPPSDLEDAEAFILTRPPMSNEEAACILDVIYTYGGDPRCDGLDFAALRRVQHFLAV